MLFLLALGTVVAASSSALPSYSQETRKAELNLEARSTTFKLLTERGSHNFAGGGYNWEYNNTTRAATTSLGISEGEDFVVARDKINALSTAEEDYFNYTQFRDIVDVENQYNFNFTWMPIVHLENSFTKGNPPSSPDIKEPTIPAYDSVDNKVRYGSTELGGQTYWVLATAKSGDYNATYVSNKQWDFRGIPGGDLSYAGERDIIDPYDIEYKVERFQNQDEDKGSIIIFSRHLGNFGADSTGEAPVIQFDRYAVLEEEPLRIGVQTW